MHTLINIFTKNVIQNYSKGRTDNKPENIPSQPSANKDGNELSPVNDIGCTAQAEEDGNAEGLALPAMMSQEWLVANTASALADDFDTTVKIMFLDVGFTFCK